MLVLTVNKLLPTLARMPGERILEGERWREEGRGRGRVGEKKEENERERVGEKMETKEREGG